MHGANYWFAMQTDAVPENHATRNRRVRRELPQVFKCCRGLYLMSMRARYRDGFRTGDHYRRHAPGLLVRLEEALPFR